MDLEPKYEDLKKEISRRNPGDAIDTDEFKLYPIVFESTGQLYPESVNFLTLILEQAAINMRASSIDNLLLQEGKHCSPNINF